jgi:hypothetical protein
MDIWASEQAAFGGPEGRRADKEVAVSGGVVG